MSTLRTIWLIAVEAHTGVGLTTLYYSDAGYTSKPADTPANTYFPAVVDDPGSISRTIFAGGTTYGRVEVGYGAITLTNNGDLDALKNYGYGRRVTVWSITAREPEAEPFTAAVVRFTGIVSHVEAPDFDTLRLVIRDELGLLNVPLLKAQFAGTSTGPTGIEGNANVAGAFKPMAFGGTCRNITPVLVNYGKEVYGWRFDADGDPLPSSSVDALRTGGETYTLSGTDHADEAALFASAVTAATADTAIAVSLLRVSGSVFGLITADVTVVTGGDRSMAQVADAIAAARGFTIDAASVTALDALNAAPVAVYFDQQVTVLDAIQRVLDSGGGYLIATNTGTLKVGRFQAPSGTVRKAIVESEIIDDGSDALQLIPTDDDGTGIPVTKLTLSYSPNFTVQDADGLTDSVNQDDRVKWSTDALRVVVEEASVLTKHPEAREEELATLFQDESDATTEATRRLTFLSSELTRFRVPLEAADAVWDSDGETPLDIGDYVTLELSRFGLETAGDFVVIGVEDSFAANTVVLDIVNSSAW